MPFIGQQPTSGLFIELDSLTASATDQYTLQLNGANYYPESVNNLLVSINGVIQGSNTLGLSGSTLTVGATLSASDVIDFVRVFGNVGTISTPTDGSVTANKIASGAVDLTTKVTGVLPIANGGTGNTVGSTTTYVNNLGVAGTNVTSFDTDFTGNALNGGIKAFKVFMTELNNGSNNYMHFRTLDSSGATDGGYNATFQFATGSTYNQNGNTDTNQANAMALGYYAGSYTIVIDCQLIDPSTNMWVFKATSNSVNASTPTSGSSIAYNTLGASKPITGFRISSSATNGLGIGSLKYGYSYTT